MHTGCAHKETHVAHLHVSSAAHLRGESTCRHALGTATYPRRSTSKLDRPRGKPRHPRRWHSQKVVEPTRAESAALRQLGAWPVHTHMHKSTYCSGSHDQRVVARPGPGPHCTVCGSLCQWRARTSTGHLGRLRSAPAYGLHLRQEKRTSMCWHSAAHMGTKLKTYTGGSLSAEPHTRHQAGCLISCSLIGTAEGAVIVSSASSSVVASRVGSPSCRRFLLLLCSGSKTTVQ